MYMQQQVTSSAASTVETINAGIMYAPPEQGGLPDKYFWQELELDNTTR